MTIQSLADVSRLYRQGVNICIGCEYERAAACTEDRITICNKQLRLWHSHNKK